MQLSAPLARRRVVMPHGSRIIPVLGALAVLGVALQIAYPLTDGTARDRITVAVVVVLAVLCVVDAVRTRGAGRALAFLAVTAVPGLLAETVGVGTDVPFGSYRYTGSLGARVLDVPLVVGLAWTMLAWPSALIARQVTVNRWGRVLVGAWAMTAGDLFLDPQMVSAGMWRWHDTTPHLPGVSSVPLTNLAGWLLVTLVLSTLVHAVIGDGDDTVGTAVYVWLWLAWTLALAVFLHLPAAAGWGALGMGAVAVPALSARRGRRREQASW